MNYGLLVSGILVAVFLSLSAETGSAHPYPGQLLINDHIHETHTEIIPLNEILGLEKSTTLFHASEDNTLPWGFVEGKIANYVEGYPVIIQISQNDNAIHFAQTNVEKDGKYEYKFRVLYSDNGETKKMFDGDYSVSIFKVVYLNQEILSRILLSLEDG